MSGNTPDKKSIVNSIKSFDFTSTKSRIFVGIYLIYTIWALFFMMNTTLMFVNALFTIFVIFPLAVISSKNQRKKNEAKIETELGKSSGLL